MNDDSLSIENAERLHVVAEEYLAMLRENCAPSVRKFAERFPELKEQLNEYLPMLAKLERLDPCVSDSSSSAGISRSYSAPSDIGEYEVIREIGRGGMGVVYEARHKTMQRLVALKVLPSTLNHHQDRLDRFLREARSAGQLHHTNIVPVFEVGEHDGVHYYAMQLINGMNLSEVISEIRRIENRTEALDLNATIEFVSNEDQSELLAKSLVFGEQAPSDVINPNHPQLKSRSLRESVNPESETDSFKAQLSDTQKLPNVGPANESYFHRVGRIGLQVAEALDYAHQSGVLHRDIKPSNLLIDSSGCVWITDFGLAKQEFDDLTATGDVVGTMRYMAPERFNGQTDARSDIYSLGLTLYELCTLRHAHSGLDRAELMKQLMHESPPPPRSIRSDIPRDLETIVLKSIHQDSEKRYQNANELAEDLRCFNEARPVKARRTSILERGWRWCRRNPVVSTSLMLVLLLSAILTITSIQFAQSSRRNTLDAYSRLFDAHTERADALRNGDQPGRGIDSLNAVRAAVDLLPHMRISDEEKGQRIVKLRNQAIAAMGAIDLKEWVEWPAQDPHTPAEETGVTAFAYALDIYAQSDVNGSIHLRSITTNRLLRTLKSNNHQAHVLAFGKDGKTLVSIHFERFQPDQSTIIVWDVERGTIKHQMETDGACSNMALATEVDQLLICKQTGKSIVYKLEDLSIIKEFPTVPLAQGIFTADGKWFVSFATHGQFKLRFWDLRDKPRIAGEIEYVGAMSKVTWNARHRLLAAGFQNGEIRLWRLKEFFEFLENEHHDGEHRENENRKFEFDSTIIGKHADGIRSLSLRPQGDLLMSSGWDNSSRVFDLSSGEQVMRMDGQQITPLGFDESGTRIGFANRYSTVGVWQLSDVRPVVSLRPHALTAINRRVRFSRQFDDLLLIANDQGIVLWSIKNDRQVGLIPCGNTSDFSVSPDHQTLVAGGFEGLRTYRLNISRNDQNKYLVKLGDPEVLVKSAVWAFYYRADLNLIGYLNRFGIVHVFNLNTNKRTKIPPHGRCNSVHFGPNGKYVFTASAHGQGVHVWDWKEGTQVTHLAKDWNDCTLCVHPDGDQLIIDSVFERQVVALSDWKVIRTNKRSRVESNVSAITYSPDGELVLTNATRFLPEIIDAESGESIARLRSPARDVRIANLQFNQDMSRLLFHNDRLIYVWEIKELRRRLAELGLDWE